MFVVSENTFKFGVASNSFFNILKQKLFLELNKLSNRKLFDLKTEKLSSEFVDCLHEIANGVEYPFKEEFKFKFEFSCSHNLIVKVKILHGLLKNDLSDCICLLDDQGNFERIYRFYHKDIIMTYDEYVSKVENISRKESEIHKLELKITKLDRQVFDLKTDIDFVPLNDL